MPEGIGYNIPRDRFNSSVRNRRTHPREMLLDKLREIGAPRATAEGAGTLFDLTPMSDAFNLGDAVQRGDVGDAALAGVGLAPFGVGVGALKRFGRGHTGNVKYLDDKQQDYQDALSNSNMTPQLLKLIQERLALSNKPINPDTVRKELGRHDLSSLIDRETIGFQRTLDKMLPQDPLHADVLRRQVKRMNRRSAQDIDDPLQESLIDRNTKYADDLQERYFDAGNEMSAMPEDEWEEFYLKPMREMKSEFDALFNIRDRNPTGPVPRLPIKQDELDPPLLRQIKANTNRLPGNKARIRDIQGRPKPRNRLNDTKKSKSPKRTNDPTDEIPF
jgi:hypothetical protein